MSIYLVNRLLTLFLVIWYGCSSSSTPFDPTAPSKQDRQLQGFLVGRSLHRHDTVALNPSNPIPTIALWHFEDRDSYWFLMATAANDTIQYEFGRWQIKNGLMRFADIHGKTLRRDKLGYAEYTIEEGVFGISFWGDSLDDTDLEVEFGTRGNRYRLTEYDNIQDLFKEDNLSGQR